MSEKPLLLDAYKQIQDSRHNPDMDVDDSLFRELRQIGLMLKSRSLGEWFPIEDIYIPNDRVEFGWRSGDLRMIQSADAIDFARALAGTTMIAKDAIARYKGDLNPAHLRLIPGNDEVLYVKNSLIDVEPLLGKGSDTLPLTSIMTGFERAYREQFINVSKLNIGPFNLFAISLMPDGVKRHTSLSAYDKRIRLMDTDEQAQYKKEQ